MNLEALNAASANWQDTEEWQQGDILKAITGKVDSMLLIEGRLPGSCIVWTRRITYVDGKMHQGPLSGAEDVEDLYVWGWRKTDPLSANHEIL